MKRFKWEPHYLHWGITAFLVIVCSLIFYFSIHQWSYMRAFFGMVGRTMAPIVWGFIFAYMLTPFARWLEKMLHKIGGRFLTKRPVLKKRIFRAVGILLAVTITLLVVAILLLTLLPEVYSSIEGLIDSLPGYFAEIAGLAQRFLDGIPALEAVTIDLLEEGENLLYAWVDGTLLPNLDIVILAVTAGLFEVIRIAVNLVLGMVLSVYIMYNREILAAQLKKLFYSMMPPKRVSVVLNAAHYLDRAFGRFFLGRFVDALIVGGITFIALSLMQMPYTALVSVIVGVTNIIPYFGPFIGGIPSALLILMEDPAQGVIFIIFIVALQLVDGNFIGPRILSTTTGISGLWVMISILVGGGLFGFVGMICGVPVFSVIYAGVRYLSNKRLERKSMPTETTAYGPEPPPIAAAPEETKVE